jgi:uncharacterized damage-inducible protein DinB
MPTPEFALTMARYNLWQNENLVGAASTLSHTERQKERGAFFGSIEKTFSHLLWGDRIWLGRFVGKPIQSGGFSESLTMIKDWDTFVSQRAELDQNILEWTRNVRSDWFAGDLNYYSCAMGLQISRPNYLLAMHFFNHQTHHRGQIHAMLTAAGAKPGATDLGFMPDQYLTA